MKQNEKFCPNCGSRDVEPDTRHTNVLGDMMFNQDKWLCNECDYAGLMPVGEPDNAEFDPSEQPTVDTAAGKGYTRVLGLMIVILIVVAILLSLI